MPQGVMLVELEGRALPKQRYNDGQPDRDLGGGDSQDKKYKNPAVDRTVKPGKGRQGQRSPPPASSSNERGT